MTSGIGERVLRKEDARHLRGTAQFVGDIKIAGCWEAAFVRSPLAHARIRGIEKPDGLESRVFVAADMPDVLPIRAESSLPSYKQSDYPALAKDKVRYVGECIAICIAPTRAEAEDIAESVRVDLEPLPPVASIDTALEKNPPLLHEEWGDNLFLTTEFNSDLSEAKKNAAVVIEREYNTARQCMNPMEGKGVLAHWDTKYDQLVVYTSTQVPHLIRTGISQSLQLDQADVRVVAPDVGGGFGYKCVLQPEELSVAWTARHCNRPIRWTEDRREHLTAGANTREHRYKLKAYADKNGRLLGVDADIWVDIGAYSVWPFTACLEAAQAGGNLPGPYDLGAYSCRTYSVATNKPAFTPYRGVARPGVCFAMELTIDAIARAVGKDPLEIRRLNLVQAEAMPYTNITGKFYDTGDYPSAAVQAADMIGFDTFRKRKEEAARDGRFIGLGLSSFTEQSAHGTKVFAAWGLPLVPGYEQAMVKLTPSGSIEVKSGNHSFGQGLETTLAQVACDWLKVDIDRVKIVMGDTGLTPYSTGAYASRGMVMAGGAVSKASEELVRRLRIHGAHLLQCDPEKTEIKDGRVVHGQASVSFAEIADAWYLHPDRLPDTVNTAGLEVTEGYKPDIDTGVFTYATHAAIVEVDPDTGRVEILDYVIFEDCGRRVNPMILDGQSYGGAAQGIGTALFEETLYDSGGQPLTSTLADYVLPGPSELPSFRLGHSESPSPYTRHGIKGVGEGAAIAPSGAIVNAINDALAPLGAELTQIPATPHRVLEAIFEAKEQNRAGASA
ncbi:xanthine dehydrogenase family protein molybdopterin-binding subunit [Rhodospirillaceae bacterium KN72]|uniref:Xanthine dehydrogenase family protein molybdopterin-binding subunit n=1 Tax=Pacificispira spongiicola TaxID=2729598 RepID=A0A7Y0DXI4_9PROT|nr:xanthine dehydrogenase family protein molybdopterin-binding subunit [Pacificispira spongiicola]NMM43406.1 xanthine dehydrogenase family protein molybdopterin-binding subunit [Pacificispira spongiicola]